MINSEETCMKGPCIVETSQHEYGALALEAKKLTHSRFHVKCTEPYGIGD
jgi:hypothetical protein